MNHILFLSQILPYPPDAGPKIRSYYVLRQLAKTNKVTLVAFSREDDSGKGFQHLQEICEEIHLVTMHRSQLRNFYFLIRSIVKGTSFIIERDYTPEMEQVLKKLVHENEFNAIHTDQLWMVQYAMIVKKISPRAILILDEHNACFKIWQRLASGENNPLRRLLMEREWRKLLGYEINACRNFDHVITVTDDDKSILQNLAVSGGEEINGYKSNQSKEDFLTIPICVDTRSTQPIHRRSTNPEVLHLGTMFWLPNIEGVLWFAHKVWPIILEKIPQATFTIAGKNPPAEIRALTTEGNNFSIKVTGYIPDPQPYLERAGVFIVPLLSGSGMRVKIIDGWCWGLPIVSTSIGVEGIRCIPGENILIADDAITFAHAVINVLTDPILSERLRVKGRNWVVENYNWETVYPQWDRIYDNSSMQ